MTLNLPPKISIMVEVVSVWYRSVRKDISQQVNKRAGLVEELKSLGAFLFDTLAIEMLIAFNDFDQFVSVTAFIMNLLDNSFTWDDEASRFIEEAKALRMGHVPYYSMNTAQYVCPLCKRKGISLTASFTTNSTRTNDSTQKNPLIRIPLVKIEVTTITGAVEVGNGKNKNSRRSATARQKKKGNAAKKIDRLMLDSGTTSYMTACEHYVQNQ